MKNKDAFIKILHAKIDEWDAEIERLAAKAAQVEAESRAEFYEQMAELKSKRMQIEEKIAKIQKAGEDAWQDLRSGVDLVFEAMSESLKSAASRFK